MKILYSLVLLRFSTFVPHWFLLFHLWQQTGALINLFAQFFTIKVSCLRRISLLRRILRQVIRFKEVESGLIARIYHHTQLQVVEIVILDVFDVGNLGGIIWHMDSFCAIKTQVNSIIYAHIFYIVPA